MPLEIVGAVLGIASAAALGLVVWAVRRGSVRGRIRQVPLRRIADVVDGERARICGTVEAGATLVAPLSGRECVFWHVVVQQKGTSDLWMTLVEERSGADFTVRDESGTAHIEARSDCVDPALEQDARYESGFLNDAEPRLERFLAARGHTSTGWLFNKSMRYREGVVAPGERVAVVAVGRWELDPDAEVRTDGYREATRPRRLRMSATSRSEPLLVSDDASTSR